MRIGSLSRQYSAVRIGSLSRQYREDFACCTFALCSSPYSDLLAIIASFNLPRVLSEVWARKSSYLRYSLDFRAAKKKKKKKATTTTKKSIVRWTLNRRAWT